MPHIWVIPWPQAPIYKTALLFGLAYPLCLFLWLPLAGYYAAGLGFGGAQLMPILQQVRFSGLEMKKDCTVVKFDFHVYGSRLNTGKITLYTSHFVFSVPLILALLIALGPFLETKRGPALMMIGLLVGIHFLHVILVQNNEINQALIFDGFETGDGFWIFCRQYLYDFMQFLVLRFLTFLLGFYLFAKTLIFKEWTRGIHDGDLTYHNPK